MRSRFCLGAAVVGAIAFGGFIGAPGDGFPGVSSAEAKEYYTRKRVNGRWITGRFPKRQFVRRAAKRAVVARVAPAPPSPPPRPAEISGPPRPTRSAALTQPNPEPLAPPPKDERMLRLRAALQAHARTIGTGSLRTAPAVETRPAAAQAPSAESPPPAENASPQPTAVSFDLQTGLKRTTFADGSVLEEEFDVEAMKGQVAAPALPAKERAPSTSP